MDGKKQNQVWSGYFSSGDLSERKDQILTEIEQKTGFKADREEGIATYWGSNQQRSFYVKGIFNSKTSFLKVSGVKQNTSESSLIKSFNINNKSTLIKLPQVYHSLAWDEEKQYEALILEYIVGEKVVGVPTTTEQIDRFFDIYSEYRKNCIQNPWLDTPSEEYSKGLSSKFAKWKEASTSIYPTHVLRKDGDFGLVDTVVSVLERGYEGVKLEFVHAHLSIDDVLSTSNGIVFLSNLYWSYRPIFYDILFPFHWFRFNLTRIKTISEEEYEYQEKLWTEKISSLVGNEPETNRLYKLALLERNAAGLLIDSLLCDETNQISFYITDKLRKDIATLVKELS